MELGSLVCLTQTDTTIGFVSQDKKKLTACKHRPPYKHYIKAVNSLKTLGHFTRVPACHKKRVRRAERTTFIMPDGNSYRLIRDRHHLLLLNRLQWFYTTSANLSGASYNETFAKEVTDIIVTPLKEKQKPSSIYRLGKTTLKRIR